MMGAGIEAELNKFRNYTRILEQWIALRQMAVPFPSWFEENGFHKIAVYGLGRIGQLLIKELAGSDVEVCYGIDKGQINGLENIKVVNPKGEFDEADLIVVTAMAEYSEIRRLLKKKIDCPVVSLEDIIYELY